jgi:transmembrane sensor
MTDELREKHLQAARREVRVRAWSPARVEAGFRELAGRGPNALTRRERGFRAAAVALAAAALVALGVVSFRLIRSAGEEPARAAAVPALLQIGEGMEAQLDADAKLDLREKTDARVVVAVESGAARFRVRHDPQRLFRVEAGGVVIEDLGTIFSVARRTDSVLVSVTEGAVAVAFADASGAPAKRTLVAGERGEFRAVAPRVASPAVAPAAPSAAPVASGTSEPGTAGSAPALGWRELHKAGKHRRAYELLAPNGFRDVRDEPGDLLLASDVARLSQHPADAAALLRRLLASHSRDPRAPSAAFTLGWVLMNELGRPREAAQAFARAEALAPGGNLAEDAMARSVEAWLRAGDRSRANTELERYRSRNPRGRHLAMLERLLRVP